MYNPVIINDDKNNSPRNLAFTLCQALSYTFHELLIKTITATTKTTTLKTALCFRER